MNANRIFQHINENLVERCRDFGRRLVAWYASPEGQASGSRAVSGVWGAESNPERLAQGKVGECAVALRYNLDVSQVVKWDVGRADSGYDVVLPNGLRADVKTTFPSYNLIWSKELNDFFWEKKFDILVSVSIEECDFSRTWIEGYASKKYFFDNKKVADGEISPKGMTIGTWYMSKDDLWDMNTPEFWRPAQSVYNLGLIRISQEWWRRRHGGD